MPLTDWYYTPAFEVNEQAQHSQVGPPAPNNLLVNGTHVNKNGGGKYFKMTVTKVRKLQTLPFPQNILTHDRARNTESDSSIPPLIALFPSAWTVTHSQSSLLIL